MNARVFLLFVLAAISVGAVIFLTRNYLTNLEQQASRQVTQVAEPATKHRIYVAKDNLGVGTIITEDHISEQPWPEEALNTAYIKTAQPASNLVGKVVRAELSKGEPLTNAALVAPGERGFMAAILQPGMRAATVNLSPVSSVGGFIFPGDRVDVILAQTIQQDSGVQNNVAETVMQNVRVLGVDQSTQSSEAGIKVRRTATLEVTPAMAEKIAMLERLGTLSLSLRSLARNGELNDQPVDRTVSSTLDSDISQFRAKLRSEEKRETQQIIVRRGNSATAIDLKKNEDATGGSR